MLGRATGAPECKRNGQSGLLEIPLLPFPQSLPVVVWMAGWQRDNWRRTSRQWSVTSATVLYADHWTSSEESWHTIVYSRMCPGSRTIAAGKPLPSSGWLNWSDPYFSSTHCGLLWVLLFCSHQTIGRGSDSGHMIWSPGTLRQFSFLQQQLAALDSQGKIVEGPVPITIEVKDINDNRPTFLQSKYEGSVRQNSRPGNGQEPDYVCGRWKGEIEEWGCVTDSCHSPSSRTSCLMPILWRSECCVVVPLTLDQSAILGPAEACVQ